MIEEGYIGVEGLGGGERAAREGGGYLVKIQNRAAGARFWLTKHRGHSVLIGWMWIARGTPRLRGWNVGNERRMGGGLRGSKKNPDSSHYNSIFGWIGTAEASCEVTGAPAVVI